MRLDVAVCRDLVPDLVFCNMGVGIVPALVLFRLGLLPFGIFGAAVPRVVLVWSPAWGVCNGFSCMIAWSAYNRLTDVMRSNVIQMAACSLRHGAGGVTKPRSKSRASKGTTNLYICVCFFLKDLLLLLL